LLWGKEIESLRHVSLLNGNDIRILRRKFEILVIDDEGFEPKEILSTHMFNITHKKDIDTINDLLAYAVILCDIRGIGKAYNSEFEGAYLIKEIKTNFPSKIVIAYTASNYDPSYNSYLELADDVRKKGTLSEEWVEVLDQAIKTGLDPIEQWKRVRKELLDNNVSIAEVRRLEDKYVRAVMKKNFKSFEHLLESNNYGEKVVKVLSSLINSPLVTIMTGG